MEIADTTLGYDRGTKLWLYAPAGIPEVWIVDIEGEAVEIYRRPEAGRYLVADRVGRGGHVSPAAFPDFVLAVDDVL